MAKTIKTRLDTKETVERLINGEQIGEIAKEFGCTRERIRQLIRHEERYEEYKKLRIESIKIKHIFIDEIEYKKCYSCKEYLTLDCFHADSGVWDNLSRTCKVCHKKYRDKNREKIANKAKEYHDSLTPDVQRKNYKGFKSCSKCDYSFYGVYEEAFKYFYKSTQSKDGLFTHCKKCMQKDKKQRGANHLLSSKVVKHHQRNYKKYFDDKCVFTGEKLVKGNVALDHVRAHSSFNDMNRKETGFVGNVLKISKFANGSKSNRSLLTYCLSVFEDENIAHQVCCYIIEVLRTWYNKQNKTSVSFENYYRFIIDFENLL